MTQSFSDPKKCVVVLEGFGNIGFRISDAQAIADPLLTALRARVGVDGATYAGVAESARQMRKLMKTPEGASPQDAQIEWFEACAATAPWRVKARFGIDKKPKKHWIEVSCRKKDAPMPKAPSPDVQRFEGTTFAEVRDALKAAAAGICPAILPVAAGEGASAGASPPGTTTALPLEGAPAAAPAAKKKEPKPWTLPPRRD